MNEECKIPLWIKCTTMVSEWWFREYSVDCTTSIQYQTKLSFKV